MSYFRKNIDAMDGYTPGEQPKVNSRLIKLNTNENPYPYSPLAKMALAEYTRDLRFYPDPNANGFRQAAANFVGLNLENIIAGNGSDDILTIVLRSFVGENDKVAYPEPSYSLYPVLAEIQGGQKVAISLTDQFQLPENILDSLKDCKLFLIPNPNAPTGNL
ncbi:MAG: aminotransferase class I/II-fold pyridoxal phosphate-dependent enzyme, partial [Lentisphaeria bacterium]